MYQVRVKKANKNNKLGIHVKVANCMKTFQEYRTY